MRTALVVYHGVNLVDDKRPRVLQHSAPAFACQQNVERFRRSNDDVRRLLRHRGPLARGRIAGAHQRPNLDVIEACYLKIFLYSAQWRLQINLNVVAQGLQR